MKATPGFQNNLHFKRSVRPIGRRGQETVNRDTKKSTRRKKDPVHFKDILYVSDYVKWLNSSIDESTQLAVKGPISQLCYFFEMHPDNHVVISTRPFASKADSDIPIILPDYSSDYYRAKDKISHDDKDKGPQSTDMPHRSLDEENEERMIVHQILQTQDIPIPDDDQSSNNALGLRAFYLKNTEHVLPFSISEGKIMLHDLDTFCYFDVINHDIL